MENSNFILVDDWPEQRQFVSDTIDQFDQNARFAVVTFNDVGRVEVPFRESYDRTKVHEGVRDKPYLFELSHPLE